MADAIDPDLEALMAEMQDWLDVEVGTDEPDCQYGGGAAIAWQKAIAALKEHHPYFIGQEAQRDGDT